MDADRTQLSLAELDDAISAAEIEVVRRDRVFQHEARALGDEFRARTRQTFGRATTWTLVSLGVLALGSVALLRTRRPTAPPARPDAPPPGAKAQAGPPGWVHLLPLVWPWLPREWQARLPAPAATVIASWLSSLLAWRRRRRV